jgi:hypothetical protein
MPYHVRVSTKSSPSFDEVRLDLTTDQLERSFLKPYGEGRPLVVGGRTIPMEDLVRLSITETDEPSSALRPLVEAEERDSPVITGLPLEWLIAEKGRDVTDSFITEPPGSVMRDAKENIPRAVSQVTVVRSRTTTRADIQGAIANLDRIRTTFARGQDDLYRRQLAYRSWWDETRSILVRDFTDQSMADRVLPSLPVFLPSTASIDLQFEDVYRVMDQSRDRLGQLLNDLDQFPEEGQAGPTASGIAISPSTPFKNKAALADLFTSAQRSLMWFDPHLDRKALRFVYDSVDRSRAQSVRLLGTGRGAVDATTLDDYRRCSMELRTSSIVLEWRTVLDQEGISDKHDRWLAVDGVWWNIPPFSAIMTNKHGSLLIDPNGPPFEDWWALSIEVSKVRDN